MNDEELTNYISGLIKEGREDNCWDFKQEHHDKGKADDLVHDIICMANNIRCKGNRYIIFGVTDDGEIIGIGEEKKEADIIQTLHQAGFASRVHPEVSLRKIAIEGKSLDILIIPESIEKPFYLEKDYNKIRLGRIYSRVGSSNTPKDSIASTSDIKEMWKQRLGLTEYMKPINKFERYLDTPAEWTNPGTDEAEWYYNFFPEYTIGRTDDITNEIEFGESWVKAATSPRAFVYNFACKYNQTDLWTGIAILYDEMRRMVPNPETKSINLDDKIKKNIGVEHSIFYSFTLDNFDGKLLMFFTNKDENHYYQYPWIVDRFDLLLPVIVFSSESERVEFIDYVQSKQHLLEKIGFTSYTSLERDNVTDRDIKTLEFCSRLMYLYLEWRS